MGAAGRHSFLLCKSTPRLLPAADDVHIRGTWPAVLTGVEDAQFSHIPCVFYCRHNNKLPAFVPTRTGTWPVVLNVVEGVPVAQQWLYSFFNVVSGMIGLSELAAARLLRAVDGCCKPLQSC